MPEERAGWGAMGQDAGGAPADLGRGQPHQAQQQGDELAAGQPLLDRLALGTEADAPEQAHLAAQPLPVHQHFALARLDQAGQQLEERGLAGAVEAEQAGHAGADRQAAVVDGDDLAEPLAHAAGLEHRRRAGTAGGRAGVRFAHPTTSTGRMRRHSTRPASTVQAATRSQLTPTG